LVLEKLGSDIEYLNRIREDWLKCETIGRTTGSKSEKGTMLLRDPNTSLLSEVTIPDLLGEVFDRQFEERRWTHEFADLLAHCDGFLVFVHPDKVTPVVSIMDANAVLKPQPGEESANEPLVQWNLKVVGTQIKMVDILQFILDAIPEERLVPVAIIVSAWDRVLQIMNNLKIKTPGDWLRKNLPLLNQFLVSNCNRVCFKIFGISAQGGDYKKDAEKLQGEGSKRVMVFSDSEGIGKDISSPVRWIMSVTSGLR
jgi:hypothetical protein